MLQSTPLPALASQHTICWLYLMYVYRLQINWEICKKKISAVWLCMWFVAGYLVILYRLCCTVYKPTYWSLYKSFVSAITIFSRVMLLAGTSNMPVKEFMILIFFYFWGLHPVASVIMTYLGVPSIATKFPIVFIFLFCFYTSLHASALMGHLQVQYKQSLMEAITPTADPF
jgi:hypothetical protein